MNKASYKAYFAACGVALMSLVGACNSNDEPAREGTPDYSGVTVRAFSLKENKAVLNNIDSVFFSIDLNNRRIFNADSLPLGTDVSAVAVKLTTDECSECKFHMTSLHGTDTVVDYLTSPDEKLNFTKPVTLTIRSYNGAVEMSYDVSVNVHELKNDSLWWDDKGCLPLPASSPSAQRAVKMGDRAYVLCRTQGGWSLSRSENVFAGTWSAIATDLPADADITSFNASDDTLYILDGNGNLLSSADGAAWTPAGAIGWRAITAVYPGGVLGLKAAADGSLRHVAYPSGAESAVASDFPVEGYSQSILSSSKWAPRPQVMIAGGRTATGTLTGATWAYDGSTWAKVGKGLPAAEGYAVARYTIVQTDTLSWQSKRIPALVAIGGRGALKCQRSVYVSRDMGMNWNKGSNLVQLPEYIPSLYGADLLVIDYTETLKPKAVKPITSWEVPVLLMFGGIGDDGLLQPYYWQGAINSLRFKPLQ